MHELLHLLQMLIPVMYIIFVIQLQLLKNKDNRRAVLILQGVFFFCGIGGYLSHALHFPILAQDLLHTFLLLFSVWLVSTNQAKVLVNTLK